MINSIQKIQTASAYKTLLIAIMSKTILMFFHEEKNQKMLKLNLLMVSQENQLIKV